MGLIDCKKQVVECMYSLIVVKKLYRFVYIYIHHPSIHPPIYQELEDVKFLPVYSF